MAGPCLLPWKKGEGEIRKSRAVGLGRVPEAGKDAGKGRKAFRRHVEEPAHGAYFPLPRAGRGWKALARGGRGGPQAPRFAAQGRKGSSGNCACGLALRGEGRPCGAGFVPRALEGTEREHGRLPFRAGGNGGGGIRRKAKPQGLACVPAGAGPGHARWGGRRKARGSLHVCAMPRRFGGGMTPGRCSAGELVPLRRGGPCRRERQVRALCRPRGRPFPLPALRGERGNALPGFPCPGVFLAPRPFQRWREQRGGRAGEGEDAAHRADETRAEGMRWAGRRAAYRVARRAVPLARRPGGKRRRAAGRGKRVPHGPSVRNPSFSMPEGTARGKAGSRAGVARRAVPLGAKAGRRVPQRGRGRLQSEGCLCGVRAQAVCACGRGAKPEGLARYPQFRGGGEAVSHRKYAGRRSLCGASPPGMLRRRRAWRGSWGRCIRRPYRRAYCRRRPRR